MRGLRAVLVAIITSVTAPAAFSQSAPGPVRLSNSERAATLERLRTEFGGQAPKYEELSQMRYYQLKDPALCQLNTPNVAVDFQACNDIQTALPIFMTLLRYVHPKTEYLMVRRQTSGDGSGASFDVYFFLGQNGTPQILFDFSQLRQPSQRERFAVYVQQLAGDGFPEIKLLPVQDQPKVFVADDPVPFVPMPPNRGGVAAIFFRWEESGVGSDALNFKSFGKIDVKNGLEQRHRFFAALLGSPMKEEEKNLPQIAQNSARDWKSIRIPTNASQLRGILVKLGDAWKTAEFSPVGFRTRWGDVYGLRNGQGRYLVYDFDQLEEIRMGTEKLRFVADAGGTMNPLEPVPVPQSGTFIVAYPPDAKWQSLLVYNLARSDKEPWSAFSSFAELFKSL
jgi:hypothetical protein